MIHLIFGLPALFVVARVIWPMPWPTPVKLVLAAIVLGASQYHYWNRLSSGSIFSPEFPRLAVLFFNWAIGTVLLLAALQLAMDVAALVSRLLPSGGWTVTTPWRSAAAALAAGTMAVAVTQAVRLPPLRDVDLPVRGLPAAFDGFRLLQLTDLHVSRLFPAPWTEALVDRALAADADLIVVTGDFIDGSVAERRADVEPLRRLRAPEGVWAVTGNHEYFFGAEAWTAHLGGMGIRFLLNEHTVLRRGDAALVLAGVPDVSAPHGHVRRDLDAALAGAPPAAPVLLLDHQPRTARANAARGVGLQLSGHTHGGMIVGLDRIVARANDGFVSGRYDVGGMVLYVNNGTALWPGFALRLGRPSELTRITLRTAR